MAAARPAHTVSGPGVDRAFLGGGPVALSAAISIAERAALDDATFYVRDPNGDPYGRVERRGKDVLIYRQGGAR